MGDFFTYIDGHRPGLERIPPIQALKDYIERCGGDPERAIVHFAPPPPPMSPEVGRSPLIDPDQAIVESEAKVA